MVSRKEKGREALTLPPGLDSPVSNQPEFSHMDAVSETVPTVAPPRRTRKPKDSKPPTKSKLTVYVDEDTARRFSTHAIYLGHDKSSLFAELVRLNCNRFVVSDRKPDALPNRQCDVQS